MGEYRVDDLELSLRNVNYLSAACRFAKRPSSMSEVHSSSSSWSNFLLTPPGGPPFYTTLNTSLLAPTC